MEENPANNEQRDQQQDVPAAKQSEPRETQESQGTIQRETPPTLLTPKERHTPPTPPRLQRDPLMAAGHALYNADLSKYFHNLKEYEKKKKVIRELQD